MAASKKSGKSSPGTDSTTAGSTTPQGWTEAEFEAVRAQLLEHNERLSDEIGTLTGNIDDLTEDAATATGDDPVDAGSRAFQREHDVQMLVNAREVLQQNEHALKMMDEGRYGICESCSEPIAKGRLQAQPGATLCVSCKSREERR